MEPKVSIIFTSYNHREYLKQALDSLLNQTFKEFELIIVDDCSSDGSQEILRSYSDSRIRLFLNDKNSGSYVLSSNYGASFARAPYIIFAQCDDWAESDQIERLFAEMESHNVGVVFSCSKMVDEKGAFMMEDFDDRCKKFKERHNGDSLIPQKEMREYMHKSCVIPNLSAALIKKSLYEEFKGLSTSFYVMADWDFWMRLSSSCNFFYIRKPLNNFRQHNTTIRSSVKMERQMKELFYMMFTSGRICNESSACVSLQVNEIWVCWMAAGIKEWFASFFILLKKGTSYSLFFPIAFIVAFLKVFSSKLIEKFVKIVN